MSPPQRKRKLKRPIKFNLWLSREEHARFELVAMRLGVSMADAVRLLVSESASKAA